MPITPRQVFKSLGGISCGVGLAVACWIGLEYPTGWCLFIGGLGAFIGFALSLPGVSARRVAGGTASLIVSHNLGDDLGHAVYKSIAGEKDESEPEEREQGFFDCPEGWSPNGEGPPPPQDSTSPRRE